MTIYSDYLGYKVVDVITGFTGIATQIVEQLNGNVQCTIQPRVNDENSTSYPDAIGLDIHTIKVVEDAISEHFKEPEFLVDVKLGQCVRDMATKFEGIATDRAIYLNGCVFYHVIPKFRDTSILGDNPSGSWISQNRIEVVDDGILKKAKVPAPSSDGSPAPGGPFTRKPTVKAHRG